MVIKFKRLNSKAVIPNIMTLGAACLDVVATEIIQNINYVTVKLGFATEIPEGFKVVMSPRSSFTQKGWVLQNSPCQIDSDYRGEWMLKFEAIPWTSHLGWSEFSGQSISFKYPPFPYKVGDRVAQVWLEKVIPIEFEEVDELSSTERGGGGFGSTNKTIIK